IEIWIIKVGYLSIQLSQRQISPHLKTDRSRDQSLIMRFFDRCRVILPIRYNFTQISVRVNDQIIIWPRVCEAIAWLFFKIVKIPKVLWGIYGRLEQIRTQIT